RPTFNQNQKGFNSYLLYSANALVSVCELIKMEAKENTLSRRVLTLASAKDLFGSTLLNCIATKSFLQEFRLQLREPKVQFL
ncbi:MAG: hypothetical protein RLZZ404_582, partial [Actinomycetota bacterium]